MVLCKSTVVSQVVCAEFVSADADRGELVGRMLCKVIVGPAAPEFISLGDVHNRLCGSCARLQKSGKGKGVRLWCLWF